MSLADRMHAPPSETSPPAHRLRFSLLALFLLMTVLCVLLAWLAQPRTARVEALFYVGVRPTVLLGDEERLDDEETRLFRQSQLGYFASQYVIQAALRDPKIVALPTIASRPDPVRWILENLRVEFQDNSELLSVSMRGPVAMSDDLRQIVDAVGDAYLDEVVDTTYRRQTVAHDALARSYDQLQDELKAKLENLQDLKQKAAGGPSADVELRELEIETLKQLAQTITMRLEVLEVNAMAPPQIRRLQPATVIEE